MAILLHAPRLSNLDLLEPLDLVDDCDFDEPIGYEPTDAEIEQLIELEETEPADFEAYLGSQACRLRSSGSANSLWLAGVVDRLISLARYTGATTGRELDDRVSTLDLSRAYRIEPSRSGDRCYPGWDIRDAGGHLIAFRDRIEDARADLEALRSAHAIV